MSIIEHIIALFCPHLCFSCGQEGALLCVNCAKELPVLKPACYRCAAPAGSYICTSCTLKTSIDELYIATPYEGVARGLIKKMKFERAGSAARDIAQVLHERIPQLSTDGIVSFVPTAYDRKRQRGYDQAALVAHWFARLRRLPYKPLLARHGAARQVGATATVRRSQLADAFRVRGVGRTLPRSVILIDDVVTTGASIEAAARALRRGGVERIIVVAFAHAVRAVV